MGVNPYIGPWPTGDEWVTMFQLALRQKQMTCDHTRTEPLRNAGLRQTELICSDCESTLRIVTDFQEAETG
ncbi:hypothetical protein LCGC14_1952400 [marine sediment metagenome]|uniref:Uncharacterized protein n=1 Tax=marine sediment metagenome TaxID=412755 RepID=A0A0F9IE45_9ZZZZ